MYKPDHITTVKTVKIYAPFPLKANERMVIVNGKAINVGAKPRRLAEQEQGSPGR